MTELSCPSKGCEGHLQECDKVHTEELQGERPEKLAFELECSYNDELVDTVFEINDGESGDGGIKSFVKIEGNSAYFRSDGGAVLEYNYYGFVRHIAPSKVTT